MVDSFIVGLAQSVSTLLSLMANSKSHQVIEVFVGSLMLFVRRNNRQCQPRSGSGDGCVWCEVLFRSLADWQEDTPLLDHKHAAESWSILTLSCMPLNSGCQPLKTPCRATIVGYSSVHSGVYRWEYASASGAKISPASLLLPDVAAWVVNSCYLITNPNAWAS